MKHKVGDYASHAKQSRNIVRIRKQRMHFERSHLISFVSNDKSNDSQCDLEPALELLHDSADAYSAQLPSCGGLPDAFWKQTHRRPGVNNTWAELRPSRRTAQTQIGQQATGVYLKSTGQSGLIRSTQYLKIDSGHASVDQRTIIDELIHDIGGGASSPSSDFNDAEIGSKCQYLSAMYGNPLVGMIGNKGRIMVMNPLAVAPVLLGRRRWKNSRLHLSDSRLRVESSEFKSGRRA